MKLICVLVACFVQEALSTGYGNLVGDDWNYVRGGVKGPVKWFNAYALCNTSPTKRQSPINLPTANNGITFSNSMGNMTMIAYETPTTFAMINLNHNLEFKPEIKSGKVVQRVTFNGVTYRLVQLHLHWGSSNVQGSEHTVDFQQFAGEMHLVHYNDKYPSFEVAKDKADGLLVWAHLLKVDRITGYGDQQFHQVMDQVNKVNEGGSTVDLTNINLKSILPFESPSFWMYWNYKGSLTTPPCYESVNWVVNKDPLLVSTAMMVKLRKLKDPDMGPTNNNGDNFRPLQPTNGRPVYKNFKDEDVAKAGGGGPKCPKCPTCNAGVSAKPFSAMIVTVLGGLLFRMFCAE